MELIQSIIRGIVISGILMGSAVSRAEDESTGGLVIETIVASVDGQPITLRDVCRKLGREVRSNELASDAEARVALDGLIEEQVVRIEAENRHVSVAPEEVQGYVTEVATQNGLSLEQLKSSLQQQKKRYEDYLKEVEFDILRSKLASTMLRGSVSVSDKEIDEYLEAQHAGERKKGQSGTVDLSQIVIDTENRTQEEVERRVFAVTRRLDDEDDFAEVAEQLSEGPEASHGGSLGVVAESDLSPQVFDAILTLAEGEHSKPVVMGASVRIFRVNGRTSAEAAATDKASVDVTPERREEVRAIIEQKRMQERIAGFFSQELMKQHSVDKKI